MTKKFSQKKSWGFSNFYQLSSVLQYVNPLSRNRMCFLYMLLVYVGAFGSGRFYPFLTPKKTHPTSSEISASADPLTQTLTTQTFTAQNISCPLNSDNPLPSGLKDNGPQALTLNRSPALPPSKNVARPTGTCDVVNAVVRPGDTFHGVLVRSGVGHVSGPVCDSLKKVTDLKRLGVGQAVTINRQMQEGQYALKSLSFSPELGVEITVTPGLKNDKFVAERTTYRLHNQQVAVEGTIQDSFYGDALRQGVSPQVLQKIVRVLAHRFDLQRDIQPGDQFKILYTRTWDPRQDKSKADTFLYTSVVVGGKSHSFYQFKVPGSSEYAVFDEQGRNLAREFLRTPIDVSARMSSGFGMRVDPILGYTKFHKGVDFAAPTGTRVFAAGNGVVVKATPYGAYGNYVLIRHNTEFQTVYAHLKSFAHGIRPGAKVKQGQVIGYVGTTGRSTGPHLHFELLKMGRPINPKSLGRLSQQVLTGRDLKAFRHYTQKMTQQYLVHLDGQKQTA